MCALAVAGITGMYLSQVRRNGVLGLIGWVVFSVGYLCIMCTTFVAADVVPTIAGTNPGFVKDDIALATSRGTVSGDIGVLPTVFKVQGILYLVGGLLFGIALFRAHVLARWATVLLAVSGFASVVLSLMPDAFYRLLAYPNGIAMIGLGYSLWPASARRPRRDSSARCPSTVRSTTPPRSDDNVQPSRPALRGAGRTAALIALATVPVIAAYSASSNCPAEQRRCRRTRRRRVAAAGR